MAEIQKAVALCNRPVSNRRRVFFLHIFLRFCMKNKFELTVFYVMIVMSTVQVPLQVMEVGIEMMVMKDARKICTIQHCKHSLVENHSRLCCLSDETKNRTSNGTIKL